ncbi:MAG: HlyD family type I secretion periplasmic adaptor subunit [Alphaproteobacteria bacterium]
MGRNPKKKSRWTGRFPIFIGFLGLVFLVGGLGTWGFTARIAGAVIASGMVRVESNRQVVQHPDGGVVGQIFARDGDRVEAGSVLLRLDDTFVVSELNIFESQLFEVLVRRARLRAERDESATLEMSQDLQDLTLETPEIATLFEGQRRLFQARRETQSAELEQIALQKIQVRNQIAGNTAQLAALQAQMELISEEQVDGETLLQSSLTQASRTLSLKREEANLKGMIGNLSATIAQLEGQITGLNMQEISLASARRQEAIERLRDVEIQVVELSQRRLNLIEQLSRLDVRSPVSGAVFGSTVFAISAVLQPAAPLMFIVPEDQPLVVLARVDSLNIDEIQVGQNAGLRFSSFDQRRTPEISGTVSRVSADAIIDEATGQSFYQAEIVPNVADLDKLQGQTLLPGMPVEAFIKTGERSPFDYLVKPLADYFIRAFRES